MTLAMNLKGGMDEREFRSYFLNSIVPLFPDAEDVTGKRVVTEVDSDPGRMELGGKDALVYYLSRSTEYYCSFSRD